MPRSRVAKRPVARKVEVKGPQFSPRERLDAGLFLFRETFGEPTLRGKVIACGVMTLTFFWYWFSSFGDNLSGDPGDTRLVMVILEHWREVFLGRRDLLTLPFFYPIQSSLGFSEAFFLPAIPYSIFRMIGADWYVAFQLVQILVHVLGFWTAEALLARTWFPASWLSVLGAFLFTASSNQSATVGFLHAALVAVLPAIILLVMRASRQRGTPAGMGSMAAAGALLGAMVVSSFHVTFLGVLCLALFGVIVAAGMLLRPRRLVGGIQHALGMWREWLAGGAAFAVSMIPALWIYLPTMKQTGGGRAEFEYRYFLADAYQWLNPERHNAWHAVFESIWGQAAAERPGELLGFPWGTLLLFSGSLLLARRWGGRPLPAIGLTAILLLAIATRFEDFSPWYAVYHWIPGGKGVRVPGRVSIIVFPLLIPICLLGFVWLRVQFERSSRWLLPLLAVLWIGEQIRWKRPELSRNAEYAKFATVPHIPASCGSFYVINSPEHPVIGNIDAMMIAIRERRPTLNGNSGFFPPGFPAFSMAGDYPQRMEAWARSKGVTEACVYDFSTRQWSSGVR